MDNFLTYDIVYGMSLGKRVIDIAPLVDMFEADEGEVEHIIGKTGMGKTYEATRRALEYLRQGYVVYTTWRLNLPEYFDERESWKYVLKNLFLFRRLFFRFDYRKNWVYVDLDTFLDAEGIMNTEALAKYLATRTDCVFMLDEGQDVFDSHRKSGQIARQSITRTRHMHKTLIVISQRAAALDVTVRANVSYFYKCEKRKFWFFPAWFKVYYTDEIDESNNYPIWVRHDSTGEVTWKAPVYHAGFARKYVYAAYDSWYMRKNMERSQSVHVEAFELSFFDKIRALFGRKKRATEPKKAVIHTPRPLTKAIKVKVQ